MAPVEQNEPSARKMWKIRLNREMTMATIWGGTNMCAAKKNYNNANVGELMHKERSITLR